MQIEKQLKIIKEGAIELIPEEELVNKLERDKPLRIKWGADPSAPDIHIGHTVILNKLRQFQDLGHHVIFLIGDFTAMIGDPTGKSEMRPPLSPEEIKVNARTYRQQVFKVLDQKKTEVVYNSRWLGKLKLDDVINLAAKYTVARMLERDDFMSRFEKERPISIHEFLYPLIQGYDSVELKSDVEVGGSDQKFNLLVGRELQREFNQEPQIILTMPLLEGTDGVQKMSKSLNNYIGITEPPSEIFGKTMSISDELMYRYYKLLTGRTNKEIKAMHPMQAKKMLAGILVERFYDKSKSEEALREFEAIFKEKKLPQEIPLISFAEKEMNIIDLLLKTGMAASKGEARRLIAQGGVRVNEQKIKDEKIKIALTPEAVINVGKRKFVRTVCK